MMCSEKRYGRFYSPSCRANILHLLLLDQDDPRPTARSIAIHAYHDTTFVIHQRIESGGFIIVCFSEVGWTLVGLLWSARRFLNLVD